MSPEPSAEAGHSRLAIGILSVFLLLALYGGYRAATLLVTLPGSAWAELGKGIVATFLRVSVALAITLIWTIPVGVFIGTNRRLAGLLQPIVQVVASIPATALFPVVLLALLQSPGGLNIAAVLLMLMGTQWYLLFNVIAGAAAIPQDLRLHHRPAPPLITRPLADFDPARAFSLHHHRSDHCERRRLECQHCRGTCRIRRPNPRDDRSRRADRTGHRHR